jgi:hypothetical protein
VEDLHDELSEEGSNGWVTESDEEEREEEPDNRQIYLVSDRWRHPEKVVVKHKVVTPTAPESSLQLVNHSSNQTCVASQYSFLKDLILLCSLKLQCMFRLVESI